MSVDNDIISQLNLLKNTKQSIRTAILGKNVEVPENTPFSGYAQKIADIETGVEGGVDTSDATALATDLALDKTAYVKGNKIIGTLPVTDIGHPCALTYANAMNETDHLRIWSKISTDSVVRATTSITVDMSYEDIANTIGLTPEMILEGNTVLGIVGTGEGGIDTSDATATATDILNGKTAYVNGEKLTGTLADLSTATVNTAKITTDSNFTDNTSDKEITVKSLSTQTGYIKTDSTQISTTFTYNTLVNVIGLTSNMLLTGNTILGVAGNAKPEPAVSENPVWYAPSTLSSTQNPTDSSDLITLEIDLGAEDVIYLKGGSKISISVPYRQLAEFIGLTGDILLTGNTVLGVRGTAVTDGGQLSEQDYTDAIALCKDIKGVEPLPAEVA